MAVKLCPWALNTLKSGVAHTQTWSAAAELQTTGANHSQISPELQAGIKVISQYSIDLSPT